MKKKILFWLLVGSTGSVCAQNSSVPTAAPASEANAAAGVNAANSQVSASPAAEHIEPANQVEPVVQGLRGIWVLTIESAWVAPKKLNGKNWDGSFSDFGAAAGGVVALYSGVGIPAAGAAAKLGHMAGSVISGPESPDLGALVRVDAKKMGTYVVRDTFGAAWGAEHRLRLQGDEPGVVRWEVKDKDLRDDDYVGSGSFTLRELLDRGGVAEFQGGQVTSIRFRLTRIGD